MSDEHVTTAECKERTDKILAAVTKIDMRLFRDNGMLSMQTRLDRHEQSLHTMSKILYGAIGLILLMVLQSVLAPIIAGG